ncbi:hypothetical protein ABT009_46815 [Streptomyces sp. NPDC002896]|uniref:hypothetical protein n=1 Tax=Streptomyces sp. NPDC002896 TaxID=3154438 RepID=UPI003329EA08
MFTASTAVVAGGVLLPTSAFAAPAAPHMGTMTTISATQGGHDQAVADPAEKWVETTDAPSGIKFKLPGKPKVEEFSEPADDGSIVTGRMYSVEKADGTFVILAVYDVPGTPANANLGLEGFREGFSEEFGKTATSTSGEKTTVDGHPAVDARLSTKDSAPLVGSSCYIAGDTHVIGITTVGHAADEKTVDQMHQQTLDGIRIPSSDAPA